MRKIVNFRPVLFLALGVSLGILSVYFFIAGKTLAGIIAVALLSAGLLAILIEVS